MTEVTRIAAAAFAVREALRRIEGTVSDAETGLHVVAAVETVSDERLVRGVIADIEKRYGVKIELQIDWR